MFQKSLLTLPYDLCDSGYLKQMTIKQVQNDLYNTEALPTLPQETRFSRIQREQKNREKLDKTMFEENTKFLLLTTCTTYCCKNRAPGATISSLVKFKGFI